MISFYSEKELFDLGLKSFGKNVLISRKCSIYGASKISIGDNVRIDDFCILSGDITIGSNIHISAYVALYGAKGIILHNYTGISPKSVIYSAMDDFSGNYFIGPIHSKEKIHVTGGQVELMSYSQIGSNCVVFPNITIGEGTVVGACSLVNKSLDNWGIYFGVPAKFYKNRSNAMLRFTPPILINTTYYLVERRLHNDSAKEIVATWWSSLPIACYRGCSQVGNLCYYLRLSA